MGGGCWWRSVTHCDTGREVASAARYILSVSHQQTLSACLPNTATAAETEAISLTRSKCKWKPLRTTGNGGGGVLAACRWEEGVVDNTKDKKNVRRCKSKHFVPVRSIPGGVSVRLPHSKHMSDHFPLICPPPPSKATFEETSAASWLIPKAHASTFSPISWKIELLLIVLGQTGDVQSSLERRRGGSSSLRGWRGG